MSQPLVLVPFGYARALTANANFPLSAHIEKCDQNIVGRTSFKGGLSRWLLSSSGAFFVFDLMGFCETTPVFI